MSYVNGSRTRGGKAYRQKRYVRQVALERDGHTCQVCGALAQEVDHIIPWAISHDSTFSNLRAICVKCNRVLRRQRKDHNPYDTLEKWEDYLKAELATCASHKERTNG